MVKIKNYILFKNHTEGMKLESFLKVNKIKYVISPTPRELSTCCGISIMYNKEDEDKIKKIIEVNNIEVIGFHSLKREVKNFYV
ncbi:DUF3343 domain-containing protein [Haloimpatiens sp. FM7315]|uniref:DUF3343 domain-containing protein n=1 Tax=Haloimpatiens sp. FM7315 TaxID=3298609 RepID=UPI00370AA9B7